jgi:hypothetical protein
VRAAPALIIGSWYSTRRSVTISGAPAAAAVRGAFTAELCDAVLDRNDSAARLAELEQSNLFVTSQSMTRTPRR